MTNKSIAEQLRKLADHIEKSEQSYGMAAHSSGGEAIFAIEPGPDQYRIPRGFEPVRFALLITDPELLKKYEVVVQRKDVPQP